MIWGDTEHIEIAIISNILNATVLMYSGAEETHTDGLCLGEPESTKERF